MTILQTSVHLLHSNNKFGAVVDCQCPPQTALQDVPSRWLGSVSAGIKAAALSQAAPIVIFAQVVTVIIKPASVQIFRLPQSTSKDQVPRRARSQLELLLHANEHFIHIITLHLFILVHLCFIHD